MMTFSPPLKMNNVEVLVIAPETRSINFIKRNVTQEEFQEQIDSGYLAQEISLTIKYLEKEGFIKPAQGWYTYVNAITI